MHKIWPRNCDTSVSGVFCVRVLQTKGRWNCRTYSRVYIIKTFLNKKQCILLVYRNSEYFKNIKKNKLVYTWFIKANMIFNVSDKNNWNTCITKLILLLTYLYKEVGLIKKKQHWKIGKVMFCFCHETLSFFYRFRLKLTCATQIKSKHSETIYSVWSYIDSIITTIRKIKQIKL